MRKNFARAVEQRSNVKSVILHIASATACALPLKKDLSWQINSMIAFAANVCWS